MQIAGRDAHVSMPDRIAYFCKRSSARQGMADKSVPTVMNGE
jgi:hypothetical protein